jgi:hypothetical protein
MQIRATENTEEFGACGCGRSPTGKCIGWHSLTEEQYQVELEKYDLSLFDDDTEEDPL